MLKYELIKIHMITALHELECRGLCDSRFIGTRSFSESRLVSFLIMKEVYGKDSTEVATKLRNDEWHAFLLLSREKMV